MTEAKPDASGVLPDGSSVTWIIQEEFESEVFICTPDPDTRVSFPKGNRSLLSDYPCLLAYMYQGARRPTSRCSRLLVSLTYRGLGCLCPNLWCSIEKLWSISWPESIRRP